MIELPCVLRRPQWAATYLVFWMPYVAVYQAVNRFPLFEPRVLALSPLDLAVPFWPGWLPVYVAYLPLFWWTVARSEDDEAASRIFYATHFQLLIAATVWILFPVTMPREMFYASAAYNWADSFWRWFDAPNNCLPSLHAANGLLFLRCNRTRPFAALHTAIALAVIASTVLVKQHYVVDLAAGALLYALVAAGMARVRIACP